jgi:hypothetical protein
MTDQTTDHLSGAEEAYYYLCGACGEVTAHRRWTGLVRDQETEEMRPARDGEEWDLDVCPACGYEHRDDDSDPGVWGGTIAQMDQERAVQFADLADFWIDRWKDLAAAAEDKGRKELEDRDEQIASLQAESDSAFERGRSEEREVHRRRCAGDDPRRRSLPACSTGRRLLQRGINVNGCVCRPGNPCLWHHGRVERGEVSPSETPYPENFRACTVPRRFLRLRERIAHRLAPWAFSKEEGSGG